MPRAFDRRKSSDDHNPLRGLLDWTQPIQEVAGEAGDMIKGFVEQLIRQFLQTLLGVVLDPEQALEDLFEQLPDWVAQIPGLSQIVEWITGTAGDETDLSSFFSGITSSISTAASNALTALGTFSSLFSGLGEGGIGGVVSRLLGIESTANTADSNATTGLGNWTSWLSGGSWANIGASVADFLGTKSTATTASSNASTALGQLSSLISGIGGSVISDVSSAISGAVSNFTSMFSGLGVPNIGGAVSSWLGTASTASTAGSNATTALSTASSASSVAGAVSTSVQNAWNLLVDAFTGGSGATGQTEAMAASAAAAVTTTANTANAAALAAQATLAEQETTTPTGGNSSTYTPSGSDGAALMGWTTGPTSGDMCIRVNNGVTAIGVKSGKGSGRVYGVYTTKQYATVDQSASIVLGELPWGSSSETTTIKIRSTSGLTNGAYCHVESDGVKIGYYTFSGGTWTFNQLATQATTIRSGDRVTFRCYGLNYYVLVNGVQVLSFTDVGNNVTQSVATNNYCGLSETRTASFVDFDSFRVTSFSMTDYFEGTTLATSFILTRSNTANAALSVANGAAAALPSFFSTQVTAVGVTVNTLATGEIQILTDGIYRLTGSFVAVGGTTGTSSSNFAPSWCVMLGGSQITGPIPSGVSIDIPLVAGNVIKPGIVAAVPNPTATRSNAQNYSGTQTAGNDISVTNVKGFSSWSGVLIEPA